MNLKLIWIIILTVSYCFDSLVAQPTFSDKTRLYKKNIPTRSLMPGGVADMDGDLVDDLVIIDRGQHLKILKSSGHIFNLHQLDSSRISYSDRWTLTVGDLDNDGKNEIITSGEYDLIGISTLSGTKISSKYISGNFYAQGSNTVDINNDGWLDYFVCDDDSHSRTYINDKAGNFILKNVINFQLNDNTDGSGNYGSEWVDVNGDLLPDLCISKCRAGVSDAKDLRRINRLYINKGNGTYDEKGADFKLNSGEQTWVTTFGDIDNDGDQDAFVVNHYAPHALMENINGTHFKEIPLDVPLSSFGFQAVMRDFDNDGFLDILIVGIEGSTLLYNQGNKTFDIIDHIIGPNTPRSMSTGDINDDGFLDIHAYISQPINVLGVKDDELWLNNGNQNHFIKVSLEGKTSNRSGIGAQIEIYGSFGKQTRYVKGGESYGIFNSMQQHFGLGMHQELDSLIIKWPSGKTDTYFNIQADETYYAQEGKCISKSPELYSEIQLFTSSPVKLEATDQMETYRWNDGSDFQTIDIQKEGTYHVTMTDTKGCTSISKPIVVKSGCFDQQTKLINESQKINICAGDEIEISAINAVSYAWSNGETSQTIKINTSENLSLTATDLCGNVKTDQVMVEFLNSNVQIQNDTIKKGEIATLVSDNIHTNWFLTQEDSQSFFTGDTLFTSPLDTTTVFYAQISSTLDKKTGKVGEKIFPTTNLFGGNNTVGYLIFDVDRECILHAVKVNTDTPGLRKIVIRDQLGIVIFEKEMMLVSGIQTLILDAALQPGFQYELATDTDINLQTLGYKGPRLVRTFNGTTYPYTIDNIIKIQSSSFGAIYYYYFYDWEVYYDIVNCESEKKEVIAYVDLKTGINPQPRYHKIRFYPNPVNEKIKIETQIELPILEVHIKDMHQRSVNVHFDVLNHEIDMSSLPAGLYILVLRNHESSNSYKIIKQ